MNLLLITLLFCALLGLRARPGFLAHMAVVVVMGALTSVYWLTGRI